MIAKSIMTPEKWALLKELFDRAVEVDRSEWARFAEKACPGDEDLQRELLRLLENDAEADSFWSYKPVPKLGATWSPGTLVMGRFRIVRFVGRGGMGEVYEAGDQVLNQKVALKTIRPEVAGDARMLARFKQEINLARKVTDPHISRIHEIFTGPTPFLTMEFLEGVTLSQKIVRDGPLPESEARCIALQLCQALEAAHKAGVVHRDFKSGNVMVSTAQDGSPWAVVTDFGLATSIVLPEAETVTGGLTRPGAIMGTPLYMAPEQLEGGVATPATDLYALGIVLYEMLTGRTPFASGTPIVAAMARLKHRPDPPSSLVPGVSRLWDQVISRCLQYDATQRPHSADEVAAMLSGHSVGLRSFAAPTLSRARALVAVCVLLLSILGFVAWRRWPPSYHPPSSGAQQWYDAGTAALREGTFLKAALALQHATQLDPNFVLAHARLADAWTELDYTDKAKDEMLLAASPELSRGLPSIDVRYVEAVRATITNDYVGAIKLYQSILNDLPQAERAFGLVDLGRAYEKAMQDQPAVTAYEQAKARAPEYPACFLRLGILYGRHKRQADAAAAFHRADDLYRASSNLEGHAEVEFQEGLIASDQGHLVRARNLTSSALEAARAIPNKQLEVRALLLLSTIDYRSAAFDRSTQEAEDAIQLCKDNDIGFFWSTQGLVQLGNKHLMTGDYGKAEDYFQQALRLGRNNGSKRLEAMASVSLASVRDAQQRPKEVIPLATFALQYYKQHGFVTNADNAATLLGRAHVATGDLSGAQRAFAEEAELGQRTGDAGIRARSEEGLGNVSEDLEQYPQALEHYQRAMNSGRDLGPDFSTSQAIHCARVLADMGQFAAAEPLLIEAERYRGKSEIAADIALVRAVVLIFSGNNAQALVICRRYTDANQPTDADARSELLVDLGLAQVRSGKVREGDATLRKAVPLAQEADPARWAHFQLALAESALANGNFSDAEAAAKAALERSTGLQQMESEWRSMAWLARIAARQGKLEQSREWSKKALDILRSFLHNWETENSGSYERRQDVAGLRSEPLKLAGKR